jgi:acyl-CoA reductase-like NAD-dependent aldehyde dehydrogenase
MMTSSEQRPVPHDPRGSLTGRNLIAGEESAEGPAWLAVDPATGAELPTAFHDATSGEVERAVAAAEAALRARWIPEPAVITTLLRTAADAIDARADDVIQLVVEETALGVPRAERELARTTAQLRLMADEVDRGDLLEAMITLADPAAPSGARVDIRRMLVPIGPVAVFGASNFPLAFGVAGGDTAAAFAAGCPVVVKAHPAHPGLSELIARAIIEGVAAAGLPAGWFSLVHGRGEAPGRALVLAAGTAAVGFTGSRGGGRALHDLAAGRENPIPVYAEMGSLNPLLVTTGALAERADAIADALVTAVTTDAGQFCVKPGLVFLPPSPDRERFERRVATGIIGSDPGTLVSARIEQQLRGQMELLAAVPGVEVLGASADREAGGFHFPATVLRCSLATWRATPELALEYFGPVTVLVEVDGEDDLVEVMAGFEGTLAAAVHAEDDEPMGRTLLAAATQRAGRVVWNAMTVGLTVGHGTNHSGPYPASTNVGHTSVGTTSVRRFLRPVAFQSMPDALLPPALRDANPLGLQRVIDGMVTKEPLAPA